MEAPETTLSIVQSIKRTIVLLWCCWKQQLRTKFSFNVHSSPSRLLTMLRQESAGVLWPNDRDDFKAVPLDALGAWISLLVLEIIVVGEIPRLAHEVHWEQLEILPITSTTTIIFLGSEKEDAFKPRKKLVFKFILKHLKIIAEIFKYLHKIHSMQQKWQVYWSDYERKLKGKR